MRVLHSLKYISFVLASLYVTSQANAAVVNIDMTGVVSDAYIESVSNGVSARLDPSLWSLGNDILNGKTLKLGISYNTNAPADVVTNNGSYSAASYFYTGFSVGSQLFSATTYTSFVGIGNDYWDSIFTGYWYPDKTGLEFSFQNESYYLLSGFIQMFDASGTVFSDATLPFEQSQIDAFWQKNIEPGGFGAHLATFSLSFAKDPAVNTSANNVWPNGDILQVRGYFDGAKLTKTEVPEPASYLLMLMGFLVLSIRRYSK